MDTDSAYIALAGDSIDDLVAKQHREHYFRHRSEWLPAECCDKHEDDYVQTRLTDAHGRLPNRVALHVRRLTSGHPAYSKLSGVVKGLSGYVVRPITASVRQISAPRKG